MKIEIKIKNSQGRITLNRRKLTFLAKQTLRIKGLSSAELSILFVGRQRIRALNKKFRKINHATDVLAFSMREGKGTRLHPEVLGDVVICPEIAQKSARIYKTTKEREIYLYLVHGILHLLGYDDSSVMRRQAMEKEQTRILKKLTQKRKGAQKRKKRII